MNRYQIEFDGKLYEVDAESEQEAISLVNNPAPAPVLDLVGGTEEQMAQTRASNLQKQLGLKEPVAPVNKGMGMLDRALMKSAPTAVEEKAYVESKYGKGSFIPLSRERALVKDGGEWKISNPVGLESGDVAEIGASAPEMVAGTLAALSFTPGPQAPLSRLAMMSGASAGASQLAGGIQDVAFRAYTDTPIQVGEIIERRALGGTLEFLAGMVVPRALDYTMAKVAGKSGGSWVKGFLSEGKAARNRLKQYGVTAKTAAEVADELRMMQAAKGGEAEAGEAIANSLNDMDKRLRGSSERLFQGATQRFTQGAEGAIGAATSATRLTPVEAGNAVLGGVKQTFNTLKEANEQQYADALNEIAQAAGGNADIVKLKASANLISDLKSNLLKVVEDSPTGAVERPLALYQPLLNVINQIEEAAGTAQKLQAVRQLRTMIGEKAGGGEMFPGLPAGTAKRLYGSLSQDIDDSISALTGPGAAKLKAANDGYKALLQPIEANNFLARIVNGDVQNPEEVIKYLTNSAGSNDWAAIVNTLPRNTLSHVRRSVVDNMLGGAEVDVAGRKFADISMLTSRMKQMEPEVKDILFNDRKSWQAIQGLADQAEFIKARKGFFTDDALPDMNEMLGVVRFAEKNGLEAGTDMLKRAVNAANARRSNMASSLVSQVRNGSIKQVVENPGEFFRSVVLSGNYGPNYIKQTLNKLPEDTREEIGRVAFQTVFEQAKDKSMAIVSKNKGIYDVDTLLNKAFGSKAQQESLRQVMGPERMKLIEDWAAVQISAQIKQQGKSKGFQRLAGLASVAPYGNLFAGRATAQALETIAGRKVIAGTTPEMLEQFSTFRLSQKYPKLFQSSVALSQKIAKDPLYGDYLSMMQDMTPEQQDAIDAYLNGVDLQP